MYFIIFISCWFGVLAILISYFDYRNRCVKDSCGDCVKLRFNEFIKYYAVAPDNWYCDAYSTIRVDTNNYVIFGFFSWIRYYFFRKSEERKKRKVKQLKNKIALINAVQKDIDEEKAVAKQHIKKAKDLVSGVEERYKGMTFRERLRLEHPDCVGDIYTGGCSGCPKTYGYEAQRVCPWEYSCQENPIICKVCWNREMPESEFTTADDYICVVKDAVNEWLNNSRCSSASDKIKSIDSMIIVLQEARMRLEDKHGQETV